MLNRQMKLSLMVLLAAAMIANGDVITLNEGQQVTGEILTEKDGYLVMDIGVDLLKIAKTDILKYEYESIDQIKVDTNSQIQIDKSKLYRTAKSAKKNIAQCVVTVAEAVVKVSTPAGQGSGFFINEQGYLITNCHVIEKETKIEVTQFQKKDTGFEKVTFKKVKIIAVNAFVDLALLKVEELDDKKVKYVPLGDVDELVVGETVFAIGNPLGLERTVTDGVVSTKNRSFNGLIYVQTNADINPGNSGGPLFNCYGQVIGVTNMGYIFYGGLGFAIPVNYVKNFIDNRESFAYDKDNPNTGYFYVQPDKRLDHSKIPFLEKSSDKKQKEKS